MTGAGWVDTAGTVSIVILAVLGLLALAGLVLLVALELRDAPTGWEDADGFHVGDPTPQQAARAAAFDAGVTLDQLAADLDLDLDDLDYDRKDDRP